MAKNVPFGGQLILDMRIAPKTNYQHLPQGVVLGRPVSFNPTYNMVNGTPGTADLVSLNSATLTPFTEDYTTVGTPESPLPSKSPNVSAGIIATGNYGPNFCAISTPTNNFGNSLFSILSFRYLPFAGEFDRFVQNDNLSTTLQFSLGWNIAANRNNTLSAFEGFGGEVDSNTIGFMLNLNTASTNNGNRVAVGFNPGFTPVIGNGISLIERDSTDLLSIAGDTYCAVGMPAITTTAQGRSTRNFQMITPSTYGSGSGYLTWTDSIIGNQTPPAGSLNNYRWFKQIVRDSQVLNLLTPSPLVTYLNTGSNGSSASNQATPWGFFIRSNYQPGILGDETILINPDASYWYSIISRYQGGSASAFINQGVGSPTLQYKVDNNGTIYMYNPIVPNKVLVAFDFMLFLNALGYSLPSIPPFSVPCFSDCMAKGGVFTRI